MPKILITGATSKTAESFLKFVKQDNFYDLYLLSSDASVLITVPELKKASVDYTNKKALKNICYDIKPDYIINCASYNDVDGCEGNKSLAMELNAGLCDSLAKICRVIDASMIHISTDYIFDGQHGPYNESEMPAPLSYYGKTKLAGENFAQASLDKLTILRTNVLYGPSSFGRGDFIRWLIKNLSKGNKLNIITGQYCNPTYVRDLARTIDTVIKNNTCGIYNVAGKTWLNRYDIALLVADVFGYDKSLICKIPSSELKQKAKRPELGGLVTNKAENEFGLHYLNLRDGLEYLKTDLISTPD